MSETTLKRTAARRRSQLSRAQAKAAKDWATSDKIRDDLASFGFEVKDTKEGAAWKLNK